MIERNRVWLAVKHFPLWLLVLNPVFFLMRLVAGAWAGVKGEGEAGQVQGIRAKIELVATLFRADLEAIGGLGKMWLKRTEWRKKRKLNDREVVALLGRYQLSLSELSKKLA